MVKPNKLNQLDPIKFENLVYDLVQSIGLDNITWRTPGADGGRDIQGEISYRDMSGSVARQKWYIECKRHAASISWPTVWKKAAFAENQSADFLLIATTSTLSPDCESEVAQWNASRKTPQIRSWNGYEFAQLLQRFPVVAVKYGLAKTPFEKDRAFVQLALEASKLTQAAYSASELGHPDPAALEAAAALSELVTTRMNDVARFNSIHVTRYDSIADRYPWQTDPLDCPGIDAIGLRATLAVSRFVLRAKSVATQFERNVLTLHPNDASRFDNEAARKLLRLIGLWSEFEVNFSEACPSKSDIFIRTRP
jgi:hypothetical protein